MANFEETRDNTTSIEAAMTDAEAITFIRDELEMTLDDDYPDKMEWLIDELMADGFSEEEADELVLGV